MQKIIITEPYQFVRPATSSFWVKIFNYFLPFYLRKTHGLESWSFEGVENIKDSIDKGYGIMLTPNHCRPCDPMLLGMLAKEIDKHLNIMASWHLFKQKDCLRWILPRLGVFSVNREGTDSQAIKYAVKTVSDADRILVLFPEGVVSRTNNRLNHLMEGTSFIAHSAANRRIKRDASNKTVIHPVAIRYYFDGDIELELDPVLSEIESRLNWRKGDCALHERIEKIGNGLLTLKEIEYLGRQQGGSYEERLNKLTNALLHPLEKEWLQEDNGSDIIGRVKKLRIAILPEMVKNELSKHERDRRWRQIEETYLAQQLYLYPPGSVASTASNEQLLETVERFEEDLTDKTRVHKNLKAVIKIGTAIEISPENDRTKGEDPLMEKIKIELEKMLKKDSGGQK